MFVLFVWFFVYIIFFACLCFLVFCGVWCVYGICV